MNRLMTIVKVRRSAQVAWREGDRYANVRESSCPNFEAWSTRQYG